MQRLATFVQVSDLHIGEIDPAYGDAAVTAAMATLHQNGPWFDGYLGHHGLALEALARFMDQLRDDGEAPRLIVTGDLTRMGDAPELALAGRYLSNEIDLKPQQQLFVGLHAGVVDERIAGNHDHWGGDPPPLGGASTTAWASLGLRMPCVVPAPLVLPGGRRLVFICIDSDADVVARSWDRVFAWGSFETQLGNPAAVPPAPAPGVRDIRVMLIHHSWHQRGWVLRMRRDSRLLLEAFLVRHDIRAILTGHSHEPLRQSFTAHAGGASRDVWELRCGTTTQHDQRVPHQWAHLPNMNPWAAPLPPNNLLVHRLELADDGTIWWCCESYCRTKRQAMSGQAPTFARVRGARVRFPV